MKEQTLIEMKNKIETLGQAVQFLMREVPQLKDLAVGTLETIKQMDDYEQAIEDLKKKMAEESSKAEEANASRKTVK
jgi:cell shape-determining protein MreC